jgi:hypothetical protein
LVQELPEGSVELVLAGDFVTEEKMGSAELGGGGRLAGGVEVEGGFLGSPGSELTPAGDRESLDEGDLGGRGGLMLVDEGVEERLEVVFRFVVQDYGAGEHAVAGGVARGVALALRGGGAAGTGSIFAGGAELLFGAGLRDGHSFH